MVADPPETPVTKPVLPTVATNAFPLLQTPLPVISLKLIDDPCQTAILPDILPASGNGLMVTMEETKQAGLVA